MPADPISDNWLRGDSYEQYIGRWSRRVAPRFLEWLTMPAGQRWLDVGCGTGALCAAIGDHASPSALTGVDPSAGFLKSARERLSAPVVLRQGTATSIPLAGDSVDVTVSALVLNFVTDQPAALREMARVTRAGGTIAAYVWDYAGRMELIRFFWDAAVELDPAAALLDEATRFPSCNPEKLAALFNGAGLAAVQTIPIDISARFADFDEYWLGFLGGQGPAPGYVASLTESDRRLLRARLRSRVPANNDGSILLNAGAWAVRGTVS